jgi:protein phosphatase/protein phosphatase 2C family protein 2/3
MTPAQIGVKMLDDIISDDPRATQGIGGDNMTIMIIDLQPESRSYRHK